MIVNFTLRGTGVQWLGDNAAEIRDITGADFISLYPDPTERAYYMDGLILGDVVVNYPFKEHRIVRIGDWIIVDRYGKVHLVDKQAVEVLW